MKEDKNSHFTTVKGKTYNKDVTVRSHYISTNINKYDKNVFQDME